MFETDREKCTQGRMQEGPIVRLLQEAFFLTQAAPPCPPHVLQGLLPGKAGSWLGSEP